MIPNRADPSVIASSTTAACSCIDCDCSHGRSTLPSSCCTTTITARITSAPPSPLETSATSTAIAPTTKAPTIGTKPPKKVSTASGTASGTPTISSAAPMNTASMNETSAWVRMKPPRVAHARDSTSVRWAPTFGPVARRSHGRKRPPSLRNRNVSTRLISRLIVAFPTAATPTRTPEAMLPTDPSILPCRPSRADSTWSRETRSLSWTQSWSRWTPPAVSRAIWSD